MIADEVRISHKVGTVLSDRSNDKVNLHSPLLDRISHGVEGQKFIADHKEKSLLISSALR